MAARSTCPQQEQPQVLMPRRQLSLEKGPARGYGEGARPGPLTSNELHDRVTDDAAILETQAAEGQRPWAATRHTLVACAIFLPRSL